MTIGLIIPTCCLFFSILLIIVFFSKKRLNILENKLYQSMIIINFISLLLEFVCTYFTYNHIPIISYFVLKIYLMILIIWMTILSLYILVVTNKSRNIKEEDILVKFKYYYMISGISCFLACFLPFSTNISKYGASASGPATILVFITTTIFQIIWFINLFLSRKSIKNKKYIPILIYLTIGQFGFFFQSANPGILLVTPMEMFVTMIMFFTIENPDLHLIEELNLARQRADRANEAKTEFLSNMSHEIRTPLNAIVGFSNSLKEQKVPKEAEEDINDIIIASDNLLEIVNGILDISKIEANKLELVCKEYNIYQLLKELTALTKSRLGNKNIELKTVFDQSIPATLYGDRTRLKQIILNLLTNAVKYTDSGQIIFKVDYITKNNHCRLIISVEDTGIGIKKKNIDQLFTKFERFDLERNTTIEGTGLGLAITKKLVELMNGKIVVQSVYGKGSKFTISIDQKIVKGKETNTLNLEENSFDIEYFDIHNNRILIVDDNKLNLKVATKLLQPYKVEVVTCNSGQECLDKIKNQEKFDLILMDDMMPKLTGTQTLQKLKELPNFNISVVVLTANAIEGMKDKYLGNGFDDYLAKPIDKKELNEILKKFLLK